MASVTARYDPCVVYVLVEPVTSRYGPPACIVHFSSIFDITAPHIAYSIRPTVAYIEHSPRLRNLTKRRHCAPATIGMTRKKARAKNFDIGSIVWIDRSHKKLDKGSKSKPFPITSSGRRRRQQHKMCPPKRGGQVL